jgi:Flp pilus assembly protein TadD
MRVEIRVRRMARIVGLSLLISGYAVIAGYAAAQTGAAPNSAPSKDADIQLRSDLLHGDLERAAEAMHKGELASAEQALRHALTIDPHSIVALNNLGIVLARQGKPAEAIPFYEEALKVRPHDAATERNLAIACFKAERYAPAWRVLEPLAKQYPTDFQILDLAGLSLFALDR